MKITIIYDNTVFRKDLQADWGFSALVEVENVPSILFDTGGNGKILLSNMEKLGIDPSSIDEVFISHAHFDHTGGLTDFLAKNKRAKIYVPPSFHGVTGRDVIPIPQPAKIHENIFSTGQLEGIEQSLGVKTDKGIVIIVGCSHPYMGTILDTARQFGKIYGIIGGLHGFSDYELFWDLELLCPVHCTQHIAELKRLYPEKYITGGAGKVIEI
ncbi:MBL fold metallo-hydrolase [Methanogenium sp. MK-MG]|uniref:MBL fold metallo-hydrolase n=1 Tax=Methanogenium sp. MK-MG TaxID=2599926 RepID=UPI0013EABA7A|nr:MBL fold metallo-hydrolase [Methanogenium sp. MK-MG]KAF1078391.1 7,8-dihydropterin-6-methyl-4-(beta-D-ribofuranosyl)-aminobenzene-5'-phosphate synthase [Methanogenium sp. MK-MG]